MRQNQKIYKALQDFNSVYSLKIYYMIEIFTIIPESAKSTLQKLLQMDIDKPVLIDNIVHQLEEKARQPAEFYRYLFQIYKHFNELVNPIGGESRDVLNRVRKFNRASRLGTFYHSDTYLNSKFDGSSLYSLYLNGCAALENKRSTHPDFYESIRQIHAPFIGALIGTSQLTIDDWVSQSVEELPDKNSKLYQYLCKSGLWNDSHLIDPVPGFLPKSHISTFLL